MEKFIQQVKDFLMKEAFPGVEWWIIIAAACGVALLLIIIAIAVSAKKRKKAKSKIAKVDNSAAYLDSVRENEEKSECTCCNNDKINDATEFIEPCSTTAEECKECSECTDNIVEPTEDTITPQTEVVEEPTEDTITPQTEVVEEPADDIATPQAEVVEEPTEDIATPQAEVVEEKSTDVEEDKVVKEKATTKKASTKSKSSFKINGKSAPKKTATTSTEENQSSFGKFVIIKKDNEPMRPYCFRLLANNGQLLFESELYKTKPKKVSIDAFKRSATKRENFIVDDDKNNTFRYKLYNNNGNMIGVGETYSTRQSCINAVESVIRFAESATLVEDLTVEKADTVDNQESEIKE